MGALYEIAKREKEVDELRKYLEFWNVPTKRREEKERRLYEAENELRVLRRQEGRISVDRIEVERIHAQR